MDDDAASVSSRGSIFRRRKRNKKASKQQPKSSTNASSTAISNGAAGIVENNLKETTVNAKTVVSMKEQGLPSASSATKQNDMDDDASVSSKSSFFRRRRNRPSSKAASAAPPLQQQSSILNTSPNNEIDGSPKDSNPVKKATPMIIGSQSQTKGQGEDVDDNASVTSKGSFFRRRKFGRKSSKNQTTAPPEVNSPHLAKRQNSSVEEIPSSENNNETSIASTNSNEEDQDQEDDGVSVSSRGSFFGRRRDRRKQAASSSTPKKVSAPSSQRTPELNGPVAESIQSQSQRLVQSAPSVESGDYGDDASVSSKGSFLRRMGNRKKSKGGLPPSDTSASQDAKNPQESFNAAPPTVDRTPDNDAPILQSSEDDSSSHTRDKRGIFRRRRSQSSTSSNQTGSSLQLTTSASSRMSQRKSRKGPLRKFMNQRKQRRSEKMLKGTRSFEMASHVRKRDDPAGDQFDVQSLPARVNSFESDCSSLDSRSIDSRNMSMYSYAEDVVSLCSLPIVVEAAEEITPKSGGSNVFSAAKDQSNDSLKKAEGETKLAAHMKDAPVKVVFDGMKIDEGTESAKDIFVISNMKAIHCGSTRETEVSAEQLNSPPPMEGPKDLKILSNMSTNDPESSDVEILMTEKDTPKDPSLQVEHATVKERLSTFDTTSSDMKTDEPSDEEPACDENTTRETLDAAAVVDFAKVSVLHTKNTLDPISKEAGPENEIKEEVAAEIIHDKENTNNKNPHVTLEETADLSSDEENGPIGLNVIGCTSLDTDPLSPILGEADEDDFIQIENSGVPLAPQTTLPIAEYHESREEPKVSGVIHTEQEVLGEEVKPRVPEHLKAVAASKIGTVSSDSECLATEPDIDSNEAKDIHEHHEEFRNDSSVHVCGDRGNEKVIQNVDENTKNVDNASLPADTDDTNPFDKELQMRRADTTNNDSERVEHCMNNKDDAGWKSLDVAEGFLGETKDAGYRETTIKTEKIMAVESPRNENEYSHALSSAGAMSDCPSLDSGAEAPFDEKDHLEKKAKGRAIKRFFSRSKRQSRSQESDASQDEVSADGNSSLKPRIGSVKKWLGRRKELRRKVKSIQRNQARSSPSSNVASAKSRVEGGNGSIVIESEDDETDPQILSYDFDDTSTIMSTASLPPIYEVVSMDEKDDRSAKDSAIKQSPKNQMKIRRSTLDLVVPSRPVVEDIVETTRTVSEGENDQSIDLRAKSENDAPEIHSSRTQLSPQPSIRERSILHPTAEISAKKKETIADQKVEGNKPSRWFIFRLVILTGLFQVSCYAVLWTIVQDETNEGFVFLESSHSMLSTVVDEISGSEIRAPPAEERESSNSDLLCLEANTMEKQDEAYSRDLVQNTSKKAFDLLDFKTTDELMKPEIEADPEDFPSVHVLTNAIGTSTNDHKIANSDGLRLVDDALCFSTLLEICAIDGYYSVDPTLFVRKEGFQKSTAEVSIVLQRQGEKCCSAEGQISDRKKWVPVRRFLLTKFVENPLKVLGNVRTSWKSLKSKFSLRKDQKKDDNEGETSSTKRNIINSFHQPKIILPLD